MFFKRRNKHERYYLFPGMGGKSFRRKQRMFFIWSLVVALSTAALVTGIFYLINNASGR